MTVAEDRMPEPVLPGGRARFMGERAVTGVDALAMIAAIVLVALLIPPLVFDAWTPRIAVLLLAAPIGLAGLVSLGLRSDWPARAGLALCAWTVIAACTAAGARVSLLGTVGRDTSALMFVCCIGLWGIGRAMSDRCRPLLGVIVVAASAVSAAIGILQVVLDIEFGSLALYFGRPTGLTSNPVYFGGLSAGGLIGALYLRRLHRSPSLVVGALVLGMGTTLSGSRVALLAAVAVLICMMAIHRDRLSLSLGGLGVVSLGAGVGVDAIFGQGANSVNRLGGAAGGTAGGRSEVWRYAFDAFLDRPIIGYGPAQFSSAVQPRWSVAFVRDFAPDELVQAWFDAHNIVVNFAVTIGAVGTVLAAAWAITWGRSCRGPLLWIILPIALTWALQPASIYTLPLCCLLFGAAGVTGPEAVAGPSSVRLRFGLVSIGAALGLWAVTADVLLSYGVESPNYDTAELAAAMYWHDPVVSDIMGQIANQALPVDERSDAVLEWRQRAAEQEPNRPYWWSQLASWHIGRREFELADDAIRRAFALQPNNVRTEQVEAQLAYDIGDVGRLEASLGRLCELGTPEACNTEASEVIAERPADAESPP